MAKMAQRLGRPYKMTASTLEHDASGERKVAVPNGMGISSLLGLLPLVLLFYSALLPPEVRLIFAGQNIYAPRIVSFLVLPWIVHQIFSGGYRYRHIDLLLLGGATWMIVSFSVYYDISTGLRRAGALALDIVAPYLIARLSIRDATDFRRLLVLIAPGIFFIGVSLFAESLLRSHILRPIAADIFGPIFAYEEGAAVREASLRTEFRLGLMRAYGPFPHPIHGGLFMASMLPLFALSHLRRWPFYLGILAGIFAFFSGSSAAYLSLLLALALLLFDKVQEHVELIGWRIFLFGMTIMAVAAHFASQNGLMAVLIRNTLNPASARSRLYIWDYGTESVSQNPAFGIGFSDYDQLAYTGESVDNYWLLLAIRHGLATPFLFMLLTLLLLTMLALQSARRGASDRRLFVGLAISLSLLTMMGFTVAFVGSLLTWFFMLLGIAAALTYQHSAQGQNTSNRPLARTENRHLTPEAF